MIAMRLNRRDIWSVVLKELLIGLILGMIYGLLIGSVAQFRYTFWGLAAAVGFAVLYSMSVAALVGSLVPMLFARMNIDPPVLLLQPPLILSAYFFIS